LHDLTFLNGFARHESVVGRIDFRVRKFQFGLMNGSLSLRDLGFAALTSD
jgi:hypothetical protein